MGPNLDRMPLLHRQLVAKAPCSVYWRSPLYLHSHGKSVLSDSSSIKSLAVTSTAHVCITLPYCHRVHSSRVTQIFIVTLSHFHRVHSQKNLGVGCRCVTLSLSTQLWKILVWIVTLSHCHRAHTSEKSWCWLSQCNIVTEYTPLKNLGADCCSVTLSQSSKHKIIWILNVALSHCHREHSSKKSWCWLLLCHIVTEYTALKNLGVVCCSVTLSEVRLG